MPYSLSVHLALICAVGFSLAGNLFAAEGPAGRVIAKSTPPPGSVVSVDMRLPMPRGLRGNARQGARLYAASCASCHGVKGDGNGSRAHLIKPMSRHFVDAPSRAALNRPVIFAATAAGKARTEMPSWRKVLTDQEIADVAEYVFTKFVRPTR